VTLTATSEASAIAELREHQRKVVTLAITHYNAPYLTLSTASASRSPPVAAPHMKANQGSE
jgi:hypothetical protein